MGILKNPIYLEPKGSRSQRFDIVKFDCIIVTMEKGEVINKIVLTVVYYSKLFL